MTDAWDDLDCRHCDFLTYHENLPHCLHHGFPMPWISTWTGCRDWQQHQSHDLIHTLAPGVFYYYVGDPPPMPFAPVTALHQRITEVSIHEHGLLGWVLSVNDDSLYECFPEPGEQVNVLLADRAYQFTIADGEWYDQIGWSVESKEPNGEMLFPRRIRILFCPHAPQVLYQWMNRDVDVNMLMANELTFTYASQVVTQGIWTFITVLHAKSVYVLRSINEIYFYKAYQRAKS
jgi:hypothetical protein